MSKDIRTRLLVLVTARIDEQLLMFLNGVGILDAQ